ncbi:hypothetical protein H4683_003767 [Filibacter limicola]|uniref:Uncharacterized protein n=1 Tax=Sporosarcina limicola TaxID=34101 RepID=A0A927MP12_9BACL|nr:hypothetical protein [Sporosarcina limicola]
MDFVDDCTILFNFSFYSAWSHLLIALSRLS